MTEDTSGTPTSAGRTILDRIRLRGCWVRLSIDGHSGLAASRLVVAGGGLGVIDVPWLVQAGLTLIVWLVATTLLPG